jgi:hypothetical protein
VDNETPVPVAERSCPLGFIVVPAFVGGLVWLCALLARLGP